MPVRHRVRPGRRSPGLRHRHPHLQRERSASRPPWRQDMSAEWTRFPIARLRYTKATRQWSLYWRDRHLRFHLYDRITSSARIDDLLREIDCDPTAIFWG